MNSAPGALRFLLARTTRNWIRRQAARAREPRYALAMVVALAYFALIVISPATVERTSTFSATQQALATIALLSMLALPWLMREGNALALSPAEVSLLFPAPLTRRQLLGFRIARSQMVIALNATIWATLLGRYLHGTTWIQRACAVWMILSLVLLQQILVALLRVRPSPPLRTAFFRLGQLVAAGSVGVVLYAAWPLIRDARQVGFGATIAGFQALIESGPASGLLRALAWLLRPLQPQPFAAWGPALLGPIAVIVVCVAITLALDVRFEDQVTAASARKAVRSAAMMGARTGRLVVTQNTKVRFSLPLATTGSPMLAFAWKNTVALLRSQTGRTLPLMVVMLLFFMRMAGGPHGGAPAWVGYLTVGVMLIAFGPRMLRNDLREDLARLAQLRTYPLRAREIVLGEIMSPAIILSTVQLILAVMVLRLTLPRMSTDPLLTAAGTVLTAGVAIAIVAVNVMNIGLQNGLALLYPGWVRIGIDAGGIEVFGQTVVAATGTLLALALSLLGPALLIVGFAAVTRALAHPEAIVSLAVGIIPGITLLVIEVIVLLGYLGRIFERTEPMDVG